MISMMTTRQARKRLGCSSRFLKKLEEEVRLVPAVRFPIKLWSVEDLDVYLQETGINDSTKYTKEQRARMMNI